jgi:hypothetical protein
MNKLQNGQWLLQLMIFLLLPKWDLQLLFTFPLGKTVA